MGARDDSEKVPSAESRDALRVRGGEDRIPPPPPRSLSRSSGETGTPQLLPSPPGPLGLARDRLRSESLLAPKRIPLRPALGWTRRSRDAPGQAPSGRGGVMKRPAGAALVSACQRRTERLDGAGQPREIPWGAAGGQGSRGNRASARDELGGLGRAGHRRLFSLLGCQAGAATEAGQLRLAVVRREPPSRRRAKTWRGSRARRELAASEVFGRCCLEGGRQSEADGPSRRASALG